MALFTITTDKTNKDIPAGMTARQARDHYLKMYGDFQPKMPKAIVEPYKDKFILRADLAPAGLKAYGAEQLIAETKEDVLVYCAPRAGHAPDAIATLAKLYGKKCVFFCPASAQPSKHQAVLKAHGADLRFIKIAAMPTLNVFAKRWAEKHGAKFLPFGLSGVEKVTAGLVKLADNLGFYSEFWMAVSTGTATRALQIGWSANPVGCRAYGVAVARNMHAGEIGNAQLESATIPFLKATKVQPPFPTTANYDAKAWEAFDKHASPGSIFINVGSDEHIEKLYGQVDLTTIDSKREWHDMRDFERGL